MGEVLLVREKAEVPVRLDSKAPNLTRTMIENDEFQNEKVVPSAQGYDFNYHKYKAQDGERSHSPALSESDGSHKCRKSSHAERATPFPPNRPELDTPLTVTQQAKRSLTRRQSMTLLWECQTPETVTDIFSVLGFDDFETPQLIPDRFIPKKVEQAKPSVMKLQVLLPSVPVHKESVDIEAIEPAEPVQAFQLQTKSCENPPHGIQGRNLSLSQVNTLRASPSVSPAPLSPPAAPSPQSHSLHIH